MRPMSSGLETEKTPKSGSTMENSPVWPSMVCLPHASQQARAAPCETPATAWRHPHLSATVWHTCIWRGTSRGR